MERDDITIIGGGPVGIWGLYHTGLRQVAARLIESLPELGGQLMAMYPEKYIYDVGGFPRILARELVDALITQSVREASQVSLSEKVLEMHPDGRGWRLLTSQGERQTKAVIIASGLGAFKPKQLGLPEEERFVGHGVAYFVKELGGYAKKRLVIVGGGDSAVDWANMFKDTSDVSVVHRLERFQAHPGSVKEMEDSGRVAVHMPWEVTAILGKERAEAVTIREVKTGKTRTLPLDALLICIGFNADLGPIRNWGLALEGNKIAVDTAMATNLPGVFAAGDVTTYPGKLNLIACGFGEMAIAVKSAVDYAFPGERHGLAHSSSRGF